jgi:hypothetical protein
VSAPSEEDELGVRMLEHQLDLATRHGARAVAELHQRMLADLQEAQRRARRAERRFRKQRRRARRAEAQLRRLRASRAHRVAAAAVSIRGRFSRRLSSN